MTAERQDGATGTGAVGIGGAGGAAAAPSGSPAPEGAAGATDVPGPSGEDGTTSAPPTRERGLLGRWWWLGGLAIAVIVVIVLAPLASPDPDGLQSVAGQQGWLQTALGPVYDVLPDYHVPGLDGDLSKVVAGLLGVALVFVLMLGLGWLMRRRRKA
jgi:cobalt/nickel transport protein